MFRSQNISRQGRFKLYDFYLGDEHVVHPSDVAIPSESIHETPASG